MKQTSKCFLRVNTTDFSQVIHKRMSGGSVPTSTAEAHSQDIGSALVGQRHGYVDVLRQREQEGRQVRLCEERGDVMRLSLHLFGRLVIFDHTGRSALSALDFVQILP
jgi:hypothetical protein